MYKQPWLNEVLDQIRKTMMNWFVEWVRNQRSKARVVFLDELFVSFFFFGICLWDGFGRLIRSLNLIKTSFQHWNPRRLTVYPQNSNYLI